MARKAKRRGLEADQVRADAERLDQAGDFLVGGTVIRVGGQRGGGFLHVRTHGVVYEVVISDYLVGPADWGWQQTPDTDARLDPLTDPRLKKSNP